MSRKTIWRPSSRRNRRNSRNDWRRPGSRSLLLIPFVAHALCEDFAAVRELGSFGAWTARISAQLHLDVHLLATFAFRDGLRTGGRFPPRRIVAAGAG